MRSTLVVRNTGTVVVVSDNLRIAMLYCFIQDFLTVNGDPAIVFTRDEKQRLICGYPSGDDPVWELVNDFDQVCVVGEEISLALNAVVLVIDPDQSRKEIRVVTDSQIVKFLALEGSYITICDSSHPAVLGAFNVFREKAHYEELGPLGRAIFHALMEER